MENKFVLVTTKHRGVFAGALKSDNSPASVTLTDCRCAIRWATTRGFLELAESGPNSASKIGAVAPEVNLFDITSVSVCTAAAERAWTNA